MNIRPEPFYKNLTDETSGLLLEEFLPNTQYVFDMWIDADDVVNGGTNVPAGFTISYTDNSTDTSFIKTGGNLGFQHQKLITPENKTIAKISIRYHVSKDTFYRWDSFIVPITDLNISKNGQLNVSNIVENQNLASISKGGVMYNNNFYEY